MEVLAQHHDEKEEDNGQSIIDVEEPQGYQVSITMGMGEMTHMLDMEQRVSAWHHCKNGRDNTHPRRRTARVSAWGYCRNGKDDTPAEGRTRP